MEHNEPRRTAFDRRAALEQLERFGRDIERYRAQRKALGDEFESFVRSFQAPAPASAQPAAFDAPASVAVRTAPAPAAAVAVAPIDEASSSELPSAEPATGSLIGVADATDAPAAVRFEPARAPATRAKPSFLTVALLGAGALVILAAGLLVTKVWSRAESAPPASMTADPGAAAAAPSPVPAAASASAPQTAPPPAAAPASGQSELTTVRLVWMRVTVDGARVLEREVPAGTRVPLNAEKTIVIRTGDAGAVQLSIRGEKPAPLGAEGEVVTRSFTVPPRRAPDR